MSEQDAPVFESAISRSRLETLFDGIFAIAMTILVLDLKVPEIADRRSVAGLGGALRHEVVTFLSYILSFAILGVMWYRHNAMYRFVARVSRRMLALQLLQLAAAAFFPFCASLLGRYPTNPVTLAVYSGCVVVYQVAAGTYWMTAHATGSLRPEMDMVQYRAQLRRIRTATVGLGVIFLYSVVLTLTQS